MADETGKSAGPTISSIAAPTADIDDDWALDDAETAAVPLAQSPSGQPASESQLAASPATEEIDSEWPDAAVRADQLRKPKIPLAPKLPEEAARFDLENSASARAAVSSPASPDPKAIRPSSPSEPRISETSIAKFELAAAATGRGAFGLSSAPPAPLQAVGSVSSQPPAAPAAERPTTTGATTAPVTREPDARATSSAPPAASRAPEATASEPPAGKSKKGAALVYGLAAAAVAIAGVGLALRDPGPARSQGRAESALRPDPASEAAPGAKAPSAPAAKAEAPSAVAPGPSAGANLNAAEGAAAEGAAPADPAASAEAPAPAPAADAPIRVTVHIYPPEAEIYHKGKRLGRSGQEIEVLPGERKLLVLIREGYWPRKLILDGKETTYNIGLRKQAGAGTSAGTTATPTVPTGAAPKFTPPTP